MELDDLKRDWAQLESRLDRQERLLRDDFRDRRLDKSRAAMRRSMLCCAIELAAWAAFVIFVASFWFDHRHTTGLLVTGLVLHVYGIAAIWASATQLLLLSRSYLYSAPVAVAQRRLAQLRRFRFYCTLLLGLPWWCLWVLCTVVVAQWLVGVDLYAAAPAWTYSSLAAGVAGIAASLWLARRLEVSSQRPAFIQRLIDDMSGRNLLRALHELDELAHFEAEQ